LAVGRHGVQGRKAAVIARNSRVRTSKEKESEKGKEEMG